MAESRQIGPAINKARIVTHNELIINDRKPNFPASGFHSLENNKLNIETFSSSKVDFKNKPIPRTKGKIMTKIRQINIQLLCSLLCNRRLMKINLTLFQFKIFVIYSVYKNLIFLLYVKSYTLFRTREN